ncbi:MAG: glycoside hydrolase family 31 protein [Planctomycetota bacterium]|nr:glycoside hydrolase family 31 protein [Planctomycetota bacterium]
MNEQWNPVPDERAVVPASDGSARFTVLTDRLIRMEWSASGVFEDRASQAFVNRRLDPPPFQVERAGGSLLVRTDRLRLEYRPDGRPFHAGNLSVRLGVRGNAVTWTPGADDAANLGGTVRTLDGVDGSCSVEPGILSRDGWAVWDDSTSLVLDPAAAPAGRDLPHVGPWPWATRRRDAAALDWYFFGFGHDYKAALRDFTRVAGPIPLPPRYVFGVWWSRYWEYSDEELKKLIHEFREHDVPLDVLVIDMDWHLDGWTGYTWNPKFFPDPEGFLRWTDEHALQITLNLHPADGVGRHEAAFADICRDLGLDPGVAERVPFDCTDRRFVESYFRRLHWPLEKQGVDFWWMDWQQGTTTRIAGLDPLWWLNYLHWVDMEVRQDDARDPSNARRGRRPLIFSRWGGLGNHRYPIGFSGDTYSTWGSLAFQPAFTAQAGNVGYAYWSHDIGGHQPGPVEPELYTRWVQFAAFSPVLRTHTSKNPLGERRIWAFGTREFSVMRESFRLRYRLLPYIYTAARRCYDTALPLCRPLYYHWPALDGAYHWQGQYMFGDDLLCAPVATPSDPVSRAAPARWWLPPGTWTNWHTGETVEGPAEQAALVPLEDNLIFARGGAVIPTMPAAVRWSSEKPLDPVGLIVWPGGTVAARFRDEVGCGALYEDDGESAGYQSDQFARTTFALRRTDDQLILDIHAAEGSFDGMRDQRGYEIRFVDRWPARSAAEDGRELPMLSGPDQSGPGWWYDHAKLTNVVRLAPASVRRPRSVRLTLDGRDESPLRAGLHGTLKLYDSLAALLGQDAPPLLQRASRGELRRAAIEARGDAQSLRPFDADSRWKLAVDVSRCTAPAAARSEAVARLLGVTSSVDIQSDPAEPGRVITIARAAGIGDASAALEGITGELRIVAPASWSIVAGDSHAAGPLQAEALVARTTWTAGLPLQIAGVHVDLVLRKGAGEVVLAYHETLLPSINAWYVVGPWDCPVEQAIATRFGPEAAGELAPAPTATYPLQSGARAGWKRVMRRISAGDDPRREFVVDLHACFGSRRDNAVAYAMTTVHADKPVTGRLALGSDDGVIVWVNGREIHRNDVQRGYGSKQDAVPISLAAGENTILLKITQGAGAWCFGAHLLDDAGAPLRGVSMR